MRTADLRGGQRVIGLCLLAAGLHGASLELDGSFNPRITRRTTPDVIVGHTDGWLLMYARDLAEIAGQPTERIIRIARDGTRDSAFRFVESYHEAGYTTLSFAVLRTGKILVLKNPYESDQFSILLRCNADGSYDRTSYTPTIFHSGDVIGRWIVAEDGRPYIGGRYPEGWGLFRFNAHGDIDSSFRTVFDGGGSASDLVLLPDGRLVVTGTFRVVNGTPVAGGFVRLTANGGVDPTFTYRGSPTQSLSGVARLPGGGLLAISTADGRSTVVRVSDEGAADPTFALADAGTFTAERVLLLADGRIAAAIQRPIPAAGQNRYAIRIFRADGTTQFEHGSTLPLTLMAGLPDSTLVARDTPGNVLFFGVDGRLVPNQFPVLRAVGAPQHVLPLRDGGVLMSPFDFAAVGPSRRYDTVNGEPRAGLVRLGPDGSLDTNFRAPDIDPRVREVFTFAEDAEGRLLVGTAAGVSGEGALLRLRSDGRPDEGFNANTAVFGAVAGALPLSGGSILIVGSDGKFHVMAPDGRHARTLPVEVDLPLNIVLESLAGGRVMVAGAFRTLNGTPLALPFFRLGPDLAIDRTFQIAATDNPRPEDLRRARVAPLRDGGVLAYLGSPGTPSLLQRHAADGTLMRNFVVTPSLDYFMDFLGRPDGSIVYLTHRIEDFRRRVGLLHDNGTHDRSTDVNIDFVSSAHFANAPNGAVLVSGVGWVDQQRRYGLARFVPGKFVSTPGAPLVNVSAIVPIGPGEAQVVAWFSVSRGNRPVLVRGVGPGLAAFGVEGILAAPKLQWLAGPARIGVNERWGGGPLLRETFARVGAFPLAEHSADAALLANVPAGFFNAILSPADGTSRGFGLLEVYDAMDDGIRAIESLSVRAETGRDNAGLIVGFVVRGEGQARVLVRGVGPALRERGVAAALTDPGLRFFHHGNPRNPQIENDDWSADAAAVPAITAAAASVGAYPLMPGSRDAAFLTSVGAGAYTAVLTSMDNTPGIASIEVYQIDDWIAGARNLRAGGER